MTLKQLLELRKDLKEKKPNFIRQDYQRRKRLGRKLKWRKPKGIHSKIRHHFKGRRKMPSPGFKSPKKTRGLHNSGLKIASVYNAEDVLRIKKEIEGIVIAKNVGKRKRLEILKKAKELNISVLNANLDEQIKKIEDFIDSKKKPRETKKEQPKEIKKEEIKEQKETKSKEKSELSDEQKKELEKKEKDKVLTKKV